MLEIRPEFLGYSSYTSAYNRRLPHMDVVQTLRVDIRIGDWLVQPTLCRLTSNGRTVRVRPKVMDLLTYLARHQGEVVSKDTLLDEVWGSDAISESALTPSASAS